MTDLSAFQHPRFARLYEKISAESERRGTAEHRDRALAGLSGRVIEVGAGNGMNFPHYPTTVTEVVAVEPDDTLRVFAESAAATATAPVKVVAGHGDALPFDDAAFDAAGFEIDELDRFTYRPLKFLPAHAHILGRARGRQARDARRG